jgi:hypothetical protein
MYELLKVRVLKKTILPKTVFFHVMGGETGAGSTNRWLIRSKEILNHIWKSKNCIVNLKCIGSHRVSLDCIDN